MKKIATTSILHYIDALHQKFCLNVSGIHVFQFLFLVGVCNTDNFSLLSITIDYGPFGFMDEFNPGILTCIDEPLLKDLPQPTLYFPYDTVNYFFITDTWLKRTRSWSLPFFTPFS